MLHKKSHFILISMLLFTTGISGIFGAPIATVLARSIDVLRDYYSAQNILLSNPQGKIIASPFPLGTIASHTITSNHVVQTIQCDGASESVNGHGNTLTYTGTCNELTVRGNYNWITLEAPITVVDLGEGNNIAMAIPPAGNPQSSPEHMFYLTGIIDIYESNQVKEFNCNDASVVVYGSSNLLSVHGTCSSLTIRGDGNQIKLENPTILFNSGKDNTLR